MSARMIADKTVKYILFASAIISIIIVLAIGFLFSGKAFRPGLILVLGKYFSRPFGDLVRTSTVSWL